MFEGGRGVVDVRGRLGGISTCHFPSVQRAASDPTRLAVEEERNTGQVMDTC